MLDTLGNLKRTQYCGALRASDADKDVVLMGWVHRRRDLGQLIFIDLRDRAGIAQIVFNKEQNPEAHAKAEDLRSEFVVAVEGRVVRRQKANPEIPTGEVEVIAIRLHILNNSKTPPFQIEEEVTAESRDIRVASDSLPRGSEVILLAEDEKGVRELAREYLEMSGYTVLEAENGHTALELAAMHVGPIHLLMTDVVMPGISGRELADRVVGIRPGIKVLYMSGYTDQAVVHHGILKTDAVLLQKPFTLATLAAKLREILAPQPVQ